MRRVLIVGLVLLLAFAAWLYVATRVVPSFATLKLETGAEISLPEQVLIAAGRWTARYWIVVGALGAGAWFMWLTSVLRRQAEGGGGSA